MGVSSEKMKILYPQVLSVKKCYISSLLASNQYFNSFFCHELFFLSSMLQGLVVMVTFQFIYVQINNG